MRLTGISGLWGDCLCQFMSERQFCTGQFDGPHSWLGNAVDEHVNALFDHEGEEEVQGLVRPANEGEEVFSPAMIGLRPGWCRSAGNSMPTRRATIAAVQASANAGAARMSGRNGARDFLNGGNGMSK